LAANIHIALISSAYIALLSGKQKETFGIIYIDGTKKDKYTYMMIQKYIYIYACMSVTTYRNLHLAKPA
jgi:hypothetical protein